MKNISILLLLLSLSGMGNASPITLEYEVNELGGGVYDYDFFLKLDNNDGTWVSGQGWRWFIFGDDPLSSPLTNFIGDTSDFPVGPWTGFGITSGAHNAPSLGNVLDYWIPTAIGETLTWSGTSTANLAQGELLFSTLAGTLNSAVAADFTVANRISSVPEPSSLAILGLALAGLSLSRKKNSK